ncbi:gp74 [Caballeronia pedi]|uniref:Gp74 n=1 Tax=Caballeronia pedi TaxID=1777141 RepID=A0A158B8F0_9BURK|nr:gp74 [Caballeronia pedi]
MKRSPIQRKAPMKRTAWPLADRAASLRRSAMKRRVKKPTVAEGSKYLAACAGEACYLRIFGVCIGSATVVPCHSNQSRDGKGMGIKAKHEKTVPGCGACHTWIDQGSAAREEKFAAWDRAYDRWMPVRARKMGLKEEEGVVFDSNSDGNGVAHAARSQREAVRDGAIPADAAARHDGVSAGASEASEQRPTVCLG